MTFGRVRTVRKVYHGVVTALLLAAALLAPERIAALPPAEREAWERYLEASRRQADLDRAALAAEVAATGRKTWTPAPAGLPFPGQTATDRRRLADVLVSFQTPAGGWSKNLDLSRPRQPGESYSADAGWRWIGTLDNDATVGPLRVLAEAHHAYGEEAHAAAFRRGVEYLLQARSPNGCWPQVYPLEGGYHDAATYNDDAMVNVVRLLHEVAQGRLVPVEDDLRRRAAGAVARGIDCILATQVVADGKKTAWCAQHDPLTLQPVRARAYEHASLSGSESAGIVELLMSLDDAASEPRVEAAVAGAVAWFRATAIHGYAYTPERELVERKEAGPLWARFYEIGTNRPIFSNRDGIVRYDWRDLGEERRRGYAWYTDRPAAVLRRYDAWKR